MNNTLDGRRNLVLRRVRRTDIEDRTRVPVMGTGRVVNAVTNARIVVPCHLLGLFYRCLHALRE